jgi:hypothetical protein
MLNTSSNGTQATTAIKFSLRPTAETLADLSRPIDPRHLKTRKQGAATLTYCPWNTIALVAGEIRQKPRHIVPLQRRMTLGDVPRMNACQKRAGSDFATCSCSP